MGETIDEITIVGGGDSGLLTALCIRELNPSVDISIVDDFRQDTPQIGKSTFYRIYDILHEGLEIDQERFTKQVKPVWKCSVFFRDWCGYEPFHFPFDNEAKFPNEATVDAIQPLYHLYEEQYRNDLTVDEEIVAQGKSPWYYDLQEGGYAMYQPIAYHLDVKRFNEFLREVARERGISLVNDEIVGADVSDGRIERIRSKSQTYEADLYVDASGFNRVLKGEVGGEFTEFGFPLDSAYNARYDRPLSEVVPATVVESAPSGWFWEIDTYDDRDLGYVFASEYASDEEALETFLDHCGDEIEEDDVAKYEFTSGFYDPGWTGNLIAIGNAGGFVEPLQSTGLTFNAEAALKLTVLLSRHGRIADDGIRETYNAWWRRCWTSIRDFIAVHYLFADGDTPFWRDVTDLEPGRRVEKIVEEFDRNGFDTAGPDPTEVGTDVEPLLVFRLGSFYSLMRNMGATSEFYETNDFEVSEEFKRMAERAAEERVERVERDHITTEEFYKGVTQRH